MGADACTLCGKCRRNLADVLADFGALRSHLHLAMHTPEILSRLRDAMVLAACVEEEFIGWCRLARNARPPPRCSASSRPAPWPALGTSA